VSKSHWLPSWVSAERREQHSGAKGIVYCLSRNDTDNVAGFLTVHIPG